MFLNDRKPVSEGGGGFGDSVIEFLLLLGGQAGNSIALGIGLLNDEASLKTFGPLFALIGNRLFQFPNFATHSRLSLSELGSHLFDFRRAILFDDRAYGIAKEKENKRVGDGEAHENRYHETKSEL